ncbi:MAG: hypothetical protein H6612_07045 [Ignavibacteriales bacterium]|nr:hypothetical protein [Ignavibacteriales bacterium]
MESFYGFNEDLGEDENPIPHGRGMSALIKYLTNKNSLGIGFVGYYKKNVKSYYTMVQDFVVSIGLPANEWWPDYLKELVNNELYTLPNDYFITRAIAEWNINTAADTLKEFTSIDLGKYQDLSAKTFTVNFNYTDLDETQNLKFKMTGPDNNKDLSLILFGIKNNKLEFIEKTQSAEYELENPKSYLTNGTTGFLVVPVNSNITQADYLGLSEIDLEIRITPKIELPTCTFDITQYNQCSVGLAVNAKVRTDYENGDTKNEDRYFFQGSGNIDGSFVGNQFIGFIETDFGYDTLKVSLSQNLKFVESVSWTKYEENTEWRIFFLKGIEASAIPINCDFPNKFEITGDEACSYIDEIYYSYWTDLYIETISDWTCSETSNITITFSKK